jgi:hypothetical protein
MRKIITWPAWLALAAVAGGCITAAPGTPEQQVSFAFKPAGVSCDVKQGGNSIGKVSSGKSTLKVQRTILPLDLDCSLRDTKLQAKVRPIAGDLMSGGIYVYPDKITVDMAAKKVTVPLGWIVDAETPTAPAPTQAASAPASRT